MGEWENGRLRDEETEGLRDCRTARPQDRKTTKEYYDNP
jgi:hypothetical protein